MGRELIAGEAVPGSGVRDRRVGPGFAPAVHIGLHDGSTPCVDDDYSGQDVVVAARISALAGVDEVLVSRAVADRIGRHVALVRRGATELKGRVGYTSTKP
jgi:class 3 adenylate cyclase